MNRVLDDSLIDLLVRLTETAVTAESIVDWATDVLVSGEDTPSLRLDTLPTWRHGALSGKDWTQPTFVSCRPQTSNWRPADSQRHGRATQD